MSTRANILIKDSYDKLWFYRHSDGYPDGTLESLKVFLGWLKEGKIRNNVSQSAGWLIILGHQEYKGNKLTLPGNGEKDYSGWKVGAYEPTSDRHRDIEFLYVIDLEKPCIKVYEADWQDIKNDKLIDTVI